MAETVCSVQLDEPLPGTAKAFKLFIALEHSHGWSHDILDGGVFGDEVTARLKAWLEQRGGKLQLIRRPGRVGQIPEGGLNLFISHCEPGSFHVDSHSAADADAATDADAPAAADAAASLAPDVIAASELNADGVYLEHRTVADVEELMTLDIQLGQKTPGATAVNHPLLLVCTHGKRDLCCAIKGRPVAAALESVYPDIVWETSHSKGHRFAPALILLPWNYAYGRLNAMETKHVIDEALVGKLHPEGCRGRGIYSAQGQVAELAAREEANAWGVCDVQSVQVEEVSDTQASASVVLRDVAADENSASHGVEYAVALEQIVTEGVVSSCGDAPGPKKGWAARTVSRR